MARKGSQKPLVSDGQQVPKVYQEMLAEVVSSPMQSNDEGRSTKRRRVTRQTGQRASSPTIKIEDDGASGSEDLFEDVAGLQQRIVESESEDSADSEVDWEDVDLKEDHQGHEDSEAQSEALDIVINTTQPQSSEKRRRRPAAALEKKLRLEIHKMNICCLMIHAHVRNHWCNDEQVQSILRQHLNARAVSYLNPKQHLSQFERSRSFVSGLEQASDSFRGGFRKTGRGMAKPQWMDQDIAPTAVPADIELPLEKEDFVDSARTLSGSRDTGAQLFCALLRAVGVDARLVCSLQPLQFRAVEKSPAPQRQYSAIIDESRRSSTQSPDRTSEFDSGLGVGRTTPSKVSNKPIRESKYPVFWVEAFNEAVQKWVAVDPLVTRTISKPSKFEPPLGERDNNLCYVIAFEEDSSARDVTQRYTKAYNAKTRRDRVESTKGGAQWWERVMKMFKRQTLDRDQVEDGELARREAAEPMPRNVLDFKDHPYYALERHLRRHEIIHPRREVGKVSATGRGLSATSLEPIYRRKDVIPVLSGDKWFRQGREVNRGEQPLKYVTPRRKRRPSIDDEPSDGDQAGTPLFAMHQTSLYKPRPVIDGTVPRNQYGNLDVYVPSMIPAGGAHIKHNAGSKAAKALGIEYADAVVGFKFSGRHGTAVTNGVVVAATSVEAMTAVITALEDQKAALELEKRTAKALGMWRRMMIGLRIRERIEGYDVEGEEKGGATETNADVNMEELDEGGGFFAEETVDPEPGSIAPLPRSSPGRETIAPEIERPASLQNNRTYHIPVIYGPSLPVATEALREKETPANDLFEDVENDTPEAGGFLLKADHPIRNKDNHDEESQIQTAIAQSLAISSAPPTASAADGTASHGEGEATTVLEHTEHNQPQFQALNRSQNGEDDVGGEDECHMDEVSNGNHDTTGKTGDEGADADDDDEDAGSLLSHDPEDEDLDPEWPSDIDDHDDGIAGGDEEL